jgi:hypothetical protein
MVNRKKDPETGKFTTEGEPNDQSLTIRVSESLKKWLKEAYGDRAAAFIREAIAEKLERESQQAKTPKLRS